MISLILTSIFLLILWILFAISLFLPKSAKEMDEKLAVQQKTLYRKIPVVNNMMKYGFAITKARSLLYYRFTGLVGCIFLLFLTVFLLLIYL
jgi:hypothetical protein